jgi:cell division protein FtsL
MAAGSSQQSKRRLNPRALALWGLVLGIVVAELFAYALVRVHCLRVGYEIGTLTKEQKHLAELQDNLRVELARLKSPQRITKIAREQLGLTLPNPNQVRVMP